MPQPDRQVPTGWRRLRQALRVLSAYAFLGWAYIAANSVTHPDTLRMQLTHFSRWPLEGTFALACFLLSAASFLLAQYVSG